MNRIIHKITPAVPKAPKFLNVAAYARVSMDTDINTVTVDFR